MKRKIAFLLALLMLFSSCSTGKVKTESSIQKEEISITSYGDDSFEKSLEKIDVYELSTSNPEFSSMKDSELLDYIESTVYHEVIKQLNSDEVYIEDVSAIYVSKEYLDELEYNSKENIYFGFTKEELNKQFNGTKYVFTVDEKGETVVVPMESYVDPYKRIVKDVAIGSGVILVCVSASVITAGTSATALSVIMAASAKTGTAMALSSGAIRGVTSGLIEFAKTGTLDSNTVETALAGAGKGFKFGAITGAATGGLTKAVSLKNLAVNDLTMNQVAKIQKESAFPPEVISQFHNYEEYEAFKNANLRVQNINGKDALVSFNFDPNYVDPNTGYTNLERMRMGETPFSLTGERFELHHIGQEADGTLAMLTQTEHDAKALHGFKMVSEINRAEFRVTREKFWKAMAEIVEKNML